LRLVHSAADNSFTSAQMSPAPMWQPIRAGGIVGSAFGSRPVVIIPASATAAAAAPTANSMSRHMTFMPLR
jgi:hypothetical protein